ncbi:ABC transporter substrate-binding protein [Sutterella sp.]|uniref:ABC transporter substrate-binding protein n=1 Tax=Sutterella sp. TaxID=1981025 RepID=UPI0026E065AB|nr:ABC transporter substrate-binding protein [Sutterella sp.]MDO5532464.1 MetQ/NlpA family ABC transporter substrate-binding protein [Sutterella sp.]
MTTFSRFLSRKLLPAAVCAAALVSMGAEAAALRIATLPASDSILLFAAESEGHFKKQGLEIELIPFKSAIEIGAAMRAGELQGHYADIMNVLSQNATGVPQQIVATTTMAGNEQRNFALLTSPKASERIKSIEDLKKAGGTETAMSSATIIDYLLTRVEETEKLSADVFKKTEIKQIPIRLQLLLASKMDTALLPEPLATVVESKGGRAIWDDRSLAEPLAVVALRRDAITPETVKAFRAALSDAARSIEADPEKFRKLMVEKRLLPPPAAPRYPMPRYTIFSKDALLPLPTEADIARVGNWMVGKDMLKSVPTAEEVVVKP